MLQIGLCDDVQDARFALRCTLERTLEARAIEACLYEFTSGDSLLSWIAKHAGKLDLVFLDIEMQGSNGMETAKRLRRADQNLQIVFVTGHPDFVFEGYTVGALGYLMKPPQSQQLDDVLTRARSALQLGAADDFLCRNSEGMYRISKASILYFYSEKRVVTCVTRARNYMFYARLDGVEREVGTPFVRIHQRYLVNATAVDHIDGSAVQICGQTLPISRAYQKQATLALTRAILN